MRILFTINGVNAAAKQALFGIKNSSLTPLLGFKTSILNYSSLSQDGGPLSELNKRISDKVLQPDDYQTKVTEQLELVWKNIKKYEPKEITTKSWFSFRKAKEIKSEAPLGLYIYGAVGGGKTMLMDLFYDCCKTEKKRRVHFNKFMNNVHAEIHEVKKTQVRDPNSTKPQPFDPIKPVAESIFKETWLICFDEFQVTDICDAMILKSLFTHLFNYGVVVVATSNRAPDDLYKNGLQRSNFVPFIDVLKTHCNSAGLDSGIDYRTTNKGLGDHYFVTTEDKESDNSMNVIFKVLCSQENDTVRPKTFTHLGRNISFDKTCGQVLDSTFDELCDRALGASDFLQIAQYFHTIFIRNIPQLNLKLKSQTRRFITLIDCLYDHRIRVVISSDVPLKYLFSNEKPTEITDEQRKLMDDLNISKDCKNIESNIFSGEEELFAFDRTKSRLTEMQTADYWRQWEKTVGLG